MALKTVEIDQIDLKTEQVVRKVDGAEVFKDRTFYNIFTQENDEPFRMDKVGSNPKFLIMKTDKEGDFKPIATCSEFYVPLPHKKVRNSFISAIENCGAEIQEMNVEYPRPHAMVAKATLTQDVELSDEYADDLFNFGIAISNSYDMSLGLHLMEYAYRQICSNGLYGWGWGSSKRHIHIERNRDPEIILSRIGNSVKELLEKKTTIRDDLVRRASIEADAMLVHRLLISIGTRKYEAEKLEGLGIKVTWDEGKITKVDLDKKKIQTEYDVINAITNLANDVKTGNRKIELQMGLLDKMDNVRIYLDRNNHTIRREQFRNQL